MKKIILIYILFCPIISMAQSVGYSIKGDLKTSVNEQIILVKNSENGLEQISETKINDGEFEFKGTIPEFTIAHLMTKDKKSILATVMLDNYDYQFVVSKNGFYVTGGGEEHKIWEEFDKLNKNATLITTQFQAQTKLVQNENQVLAMKNVTQNALDDLKEKEIELLKKYNNTVVAAYVISLSMGSVTKEMLSERYSILGDNAKSSFVGKQIADRILHLQSLTVGSVAPDFDGKMYDSGVLNLYKTKAKAKLIYFWASWNQESRGQNVSLLKLYKNYRSKGLEIIGVSLDDNNADWIKSIREDGNTWFNVNNNSENTSTISEIYNILDIPSNYLIDEDNRIIGINLSSEELEKEINKMLTKKKIK